MFVIHLRYITFYDEMLIQVFQNLVEMIVKYFKFFFFVTRFISWYYISLLYPVRLNWRPQFGIISPCNFGFYTKRWLKQKIDKKGKICRKSFLHLNVIVISDLKRPMSSYWYLVLSITLLVADQVFWELFIRLYWGRLLCPSVWDSPSLFSFDTTLLNLLSAIYCAYIFNG